MVLYDFQLSILKGIFMGEYIGCNNTKKELISYEIGQRSHEVIGKVGELLIDFLSLDFVTIEKIRTECLEKLKERRESAKETEKDLATSEAFHMMLKLDEANINHPYFNLTTNFLYTLLNEEEKDEYNLLLIAQSLNEAIDFCCNLEYDNRLNQLSSIQRYYLYLEQHFASENKTLFNSYTHNMKTSFSLNDSGFADDLCAMLFNDYCEYIISPTSNEVINFIQKQKIFPTFLFQADTVFDYLFFEFIKMIELNVQVSVCKNCGKYFILKGDYATDYCDRVPDGKKMTCKKIAAINARKNKVQGNPILKEYEKAYKRMYARQSSHKITAEDFRLWVEAASSKRDLVTAEYNQNPSDDIIQQFKKYLGNK